MIVLVRKVSRLGPAQLWARVCAGHDDGQGYSSWKSNSIHMRRSRLCTNTFLARLLFQRTLTSMRDQDAARSRSQQKHSNVHPAFTYQFLTVSHHDSRLLCPLACNGCSFALHKKQKSLANQSPSGSIVTNSRLKLKIVLENAKWEPYFSSPRFLSKFDATSAISAAPTPLPSFAIPMRIRFSPLLPISGTSLSAVRICSSNPG